MAKETKPQAPAQAVEAKASDESESAPAAPIKPAAQAKPAAPARFRVWQYGALHCDGVVFAPGEELPLTEAQVEALALGPVAVRIEG